MGSRVLHWALIAAFLVTFAAAAIFGDIGSTGARDLDDTLSVITMVLAALAGFVVYRPWVFLLALVPHVAEAFGAFTPEYETSSEGMAFYWMLFLAIAIGAGLFFRLVAELGRKRLRGAAP